MGRSTTALVWLATRGLVVWLLVVPQSWVFGDVDYFAHSLARLGQAGLGHTLVEYPLPAVAVLAAPWLLVNALGHADWYASAVLVLALLTDAGFAVLLRRVASDRSPALWMWLLAVPLLGATADARFDLVPGVLVGVAVLLLSRHPRLAAAAAALATGVKLWPALVLPAMAARAGHRRLVLGVVAVVGTALAGLSLLLAGWSRLVSPLTWQAHRGLQIESVLATPAMVGWSADPHALHVSYTEHNAYEVSGRGVSLLLAGTDLLTVLLAVGLIGLWWLAWRQGPVLTPAAVSWVVLASVTGFMTTSKVLSPQYLLWLLPAAAAALATTGARDARLVSWCAALLVAAGLTQLVFPTMYGGLVAHTAQTATALVALTLRNALLVTLTASAWWESWRQLRAVPQRGIALERQPPSPEGYDAVSLR